MWHPARSSSPVDDHIKKIFIYFKMADWPPFLLGKIGFHLCMNHGLGPVFRDELMDWLQIWHPAETSSPVDAHFKNTLICIKMDDWWPFLFAKMTYMHI